WRDCPRLPASRPHWGRLDIAFRQSPSGLTQQLVVQFRRLCRRHADHRVVAISRNDVAIAEHTNWIAARLHRADPTTDLVAEHRQSAISRGEMFETVRSDGALRYLRFDVVPPTLTLLTVGGATLAGWHDAALAPPIRQRCGQ